MCMFEGQFDMRRRGFKPSATKSWRPTEGVAENGWRLSRPRPKQSFGRGRQDLVEAGLNPLRHVLGGAYD